MADKPFYFRFVEPAHCAATRSYRLQLQTPPSLLNDVFRLIVSEVVLAPEPNRLRHNLSQSSRELRFQRITTHFRAI
jgi:hypothetical protein